MLQRDGVSIGVEPEDRRRPFRRVDEAHEELDRRGLPRPIRTEIAEYLAFVHGEVEVEDAVSRSVVLRKALRLNRDRQSVLLLSTYASLRGQPKRTYM